MTYTAIALVCSVPILAAPAAAATTEKVVLRAANGRFIRATDDGGVRADSLMPSAKETFVLESRGNHDVILKSTDGRCLMADPHDGHTPRLLIAETLPPGSEVPEVVSAPHSRFALRPRVRGSLLAFTPAERSDAPSPPGSPSLGEMVEIFRMSELPAMLETAVPAAVRTLAAEELAGKQYDTTGKHDTERYVNVPAPTLKDPKRKKRVQVLGITEEYRVQAELDGQADIRIPTMLLLTNYADGGPGLILLAVDARLPVRGRVQCKLPNLASISTSYRITVQLSAVAEVAARHDGNDVTFAPPEVKDLHISVARMEFSNDLLEAVRREIRRIANRELARNETRIRQRANQALQKAISSREVRVPLLGLLNVL